MDTKTEIDHLVGKELTVDKTLSLTTEDHHMMYVHKIDMAIGEEAMDTKNMELEMTVEIKVEIE